MIFFKRLLRMSALGSTALCSVFLVTAGTATTGRVVAEPAATLEGSWGGGGNVVLPSGDQEKARCHAKFSRHSQGFSMQATCATASAKVGGTGLLQQVSANNFAGNFHNDEFNVSGTIRIQLHGNRLSASLRSDAGASANLSLSR